MTLANDEGRPAGPRPSSGHAGGGDGGPRPGPARSVWADMLLPEPDPADDDGGNGNGNGHVDPGGQGFSPPGDGALRWPMTSLPPLFGQQLPDAPPAQPE